MNWILLNIVGVLLAFVAASATSTLFAEEVGISVTPNSWNAGTTTPGGTLKTWGSNTAVGKGFFKVTNLSNVAVGVRLTGTTTTPDPPGTSWTLGTSTGATTYTMAWGVTATLGTEPTWNAIQTNTPTTLGGAGATIAAGGNSWFDLRLQTATQTVGLANSHTSTLRIAIDATASAVAGKWFYSPTANAYFTNIGNETIYDIHEGGVTSGNRTWNRNSFETTINSTDYANLYADGIIQYVDVVWSTYWDSFYTGSNTGYCGHAYAYTRRWYYSTNGAWSNGSRYTTQGGSFPRWVKSLVGPQ